MLEGALSSAWLCSPVSPVSALSAALAETRLELIRQLEEQVQWPEEQKAFLRATLERATAEIERRLAGR